VQWTTFLNAFIDHDAAHKYTKKILMSVLRKGGSKNCVIVKVFFFSFLFQTYSKNMEQKFSSPPQIIPILSVPNFCKSFAFGTFLHRNVIALADVFRVSCPWKGISVYHFYLQCILIPRTHKMPCSSSLPTHQILQSDAHNSHDSFVCKYCSNSVCLLDCSTD